VPGSFNSNVCVTRKSGALGLAFLRDTHDIPLCSHQLRKMMKFEDRLSDFEKVEWDKIQGFMEMEGNITKSSNDEKVINQFTSVKEYSPIKVNQTWKYSKDQIEFDIVCLDYDYVERERIGDGQIGTPSRVTNYKFTSFWLIVKNMKMIPKIRIEPVTAMKKLNQLVRGIRINGITSFNLYYVINTTNLEKTKSILSEDVQELFVDKRKIWFESLRDTILIRDDKPIEFKSFKRKFEFTLGLLRNIN
jgi:hypothetical protein